MLNEIIVKKHYAKKALRERINCPCNTMEVKCDTCQDICDGIRWQCTIIKRMERLSVREKKYCERHSCQCNVCRLRIVG